nr:F-box protein At1g70590 [Tanacetum cinerariifolium]
KTLVNIEKALDLFLKGSQRGSTMAIVDAWLVYWEIRKKEEGVRMETDMFFWLPVADLQSAIDGVFLRCNWSESIIALCHDGYSHTTS